VGGGDEKAECGLVLVVCHDAAVKRWMTAVALAMCVAVVAACGGDGGSSGASSGGSKARDVLKVAFVYVGPVGDAGWTKKHDDGRKALEEALGDRVETTYLESVPEGAQSQRVFEDLARKGYRLIFGASFGYMDPMLAAAKKYPDTVFMHATGFKTAKNMGTYFGAAEEGRYLAGIAAGKATKNGRLGYVAAFPIPEVLRGINAFTLGVRSVRPDATVQVAWTSTWFGPDTEKQAAESLLATGIDVLSQHQDTPATGEAAEAAGAKWAGYNDDMANFAPHAWLTAPTWDWGPFYIKTAQQVLDGTWKSEQYYGDMADGLVNMAPFGPSVDDATKQLIAEKEQAIKDGSFAPFTGPITDQSGKERIPAGKSA
jgi:basic membrane protein A and related proteins